MHATQKPLPVAMILLASCSPAGTAAYRTTTPSETTSGERPAEEHRPASRPRAEATTPSAPDREPEVDALARALEARLTVHTRPDGTRILSRRCRESLVPCEARLRAFATLIHRSARRHALDPYLLAALAFRESGLDPFVLGRRREAGIVQLHPRGAGRDVRYVQDAAYREQCRSELDACQGPVLERGASTLARAIDACGGLVAGLGAYATGHCTEHTEHAQRVLAERRRLRELSRAEP